MSLKLLTANDLHSGAVVFLKNDGTWSSYISEAQMSETPECEQNLMVQGQEAEDTQKVVGPFLIEIELQNGIPVPKRFREQLRVQGPSVKLEFSKPAFAPELREVA